MSDAALNYQPEPGRFDEAVEASGQLRPSWATVTRALGGVAPSLVQERQRQADRLLDAEGAGHLVHELALERWTDRRGVSAVDMHRSRPWRLDPVPYVITGDEFAALAAGVTQRMRALELVLADAYGSCSLARDGVVPSSLLRGSTRWHRAEGYRAPTRNLVHYAVDVVRDAAGIWRVVQDLTDAPSGLGYALLDRVVLARLLPDALRAAGVSPIHEHADALRRALTAVAPSDRRSPRTVVLTSGPGHPTYVEHSYLATRLGYHLAEGADLVMRQGRLWLRALDGLEPVDVVYRRVEDAGLDPLEAHHFGGGGGVPGIVWGARGGGVALGNAYGAGLVEAPELRASLADACASLLGEPLQLAQWSAEHGCASVPVANASSPGMLVPAAVVVRLQLVAAPDGITVMPGGAGRVLAPGDDPAVPTAELVKDVWITGATTTAPRLPLRVAPPPQVDFGASVPKRAADALYWLGRAAERGEVAARTVRVVVTQLDQDPMLPTTAEGGWALGVVALLRASQALPQGTGGADAQRPALVEQVLHEVQGATATVAAQLAALVQEATSVREFLSSMTGRVLGRLARLRQELLGPNAVPDDLDTVLVDLAALAGLVTESTVRGPAWRFLDLGRRLERALAVLGAVEAALGMQVDAFAFQPLAEAVLSANESLVAYRRRYRSDVDLGAVLDLLVRDDTNPRSLSYQLDRLREHVAALGWPDGLELVQRASLGALEDVDAVVAGGRRLAVDSLVLAVRGPLLALSDAIALRWFADPVNPTVVRGQ